MVKWWSLGTQHPQGVFIEHGELHWHRANGSVTRIIIDDLKQVSLRSHQNQVYWHLVDQYENMAVIPEDTMGMPIIRQYLSSWRGFDYDALCRFELGSANTKLWPLVEQKHRA
jgi:hypothetical protein